jgi:hypothetical protein
MKTPDHTPGHVSRAKDPAIVAESQSILKTIGKAFLILALVITLWGVHSWISSAKIRAEEDQKAKAVATKAAAEEALKNPTPPAIQRTIAPAEKPWTMRTMEIPAEGLPVYLYQGWQDFPIGGAITITTPGGQVLHDKPGVINHFGFQLDGLYTFRADPVGSTRQVQVMNRW